MSTSSVAELQQKLFKRIGINTPTPTRPQQILARGSRKPPTRKGQRKAQRVEKKSKRYGGRLATNGHSSGDRKARPPFPSKQETGVRRPPTESIVKNVHGALDDSEVSESMSEVTDDLINQDESEDSGDNSDEDDDANRFDGDPKPKPNISKSTQEKLAQDDAEIEAFERKLGIKKGRKSLPQSFNEDGLGDLLGEADGVDSKQNVDIDQQKRKRDYDDWLSAKRMKIATGAPAKVKPSKQRLAEDTGNDKSSELNSDSDLLMPNGDGVEKERKREPTPDDDSLVGFDSDGEKEQPVTPMRENPYVAPATGNVVAKYVPPSLRKGSIAESEQRARLQRNIQGLVNRLTDANILSIVQSIEELYQKNARGDVTEIITDIILAQIYKPELLPDQFFVLTGGFTAAIYKIVGSSFGSHVIRRLVQDLARDYDQAGDGNTSTRREASNLVNLLTQLYVFDVVSCRIMFDYMEKFLGKLSELNVELLLRICRMAGRMLRRDDAQSLKHIASVLNTNMSKGGYESVSVRTKFMVETINDLKNSKSKGKGFDSAVVSEHVVRMKKRIGELKSQSRRLDGLAPMGMSLRDIEGADSDGKWWLVGASVPVKTKNSTVRETEGESDGSSTDDEDMDFVLPDYPQKARSQGFSTLAQIAIFTALMSANNFEHGYRQFVNLKLKKDDQLEIARVLVQCVGSEADYNEFYALVANQACSNNKLRFAFQDRLWKIFRGLGESMFGDEADDEESAESERMKDPRRLANVARFYASLVADGSLGIAVLKPLDLPEINSWTSDFVEHFLVRLLAHCKGRSSNEDATVEKIFGAARQLPGVAAGLHWFLRKKVRKSELIGAKDSKKMERVRQKAQAAVQAIEVA